ncbi:Ger(x)C family spore germination protein [Bacillus mycoides]|uniref:Ger(x)C family spore germination protein n=1 Tax=Bacillus mycoides TaxID=1405 RepID=UPI0021120559|nr:Ger(x)C family spore germination protein [Bacillus mycoides]MCQ6530458.1 Ger(x)C family spore germination protein [Bacillus mycoides]
MKNPMVILLVIIFSVLLTGCWSKKELNDIAINMAVGIDKIGDQYLVSCQVVNPEGVAASKGGSGVAPVILFQEKGDNISVVMRKITKIAPREIYWSHIRMLIIDEKVAREGLKKILDVFLRNHDIRSDFYIAISKDKKAEEILNVLTPFEKIPANRLFSSLNISHKDWAPTVAVTIDNLISTIISDGIHPVITGITIKGDKNSGGKIQNIQKIKPTAFLQYTDNALFKNDKLLGWINSQQSKGYNFITNNIKGTVESIPCSNDEDNTENAIVEVIKSNTKIKGKVKDGRPLVTIKVHVTAIITEVQCKKLNLTDPKTIYQLERKGEKKILKLMKGALEVTQNKYKIDIFGFGDVIHRENPKYWSTVKKHWDQQFIHLPVNIKVHLHIKHTEGIDNTFFNE